MKLQNIGFQCSLDLPEDYACSMEIHSPRLFARTVQSFCALERGDDPPEPYMLLNEKGKLDASKLLCVLTDPFSVDFNTRKMVNLLYNSICSALHEDVEKLSAWMRLMQQGADIIEGICRNFHTDVVQTGSVTCMDFCKCLGYSLIPDRMILS